MIHDDSRHSDDDMWDVHEMMPICSKWRQQYGRSVEDVQKMESTTMCGRRRWCAKEVGNGRLTAAQFYNELISTCVCFVWSVFVVNVRDMLPKMYKNDDNAWEEVAEWWRYVSVRERKWQCANVRLATCVCKNACCKRQPEWQPRQPTTGWRCKNDDVKQAIGNNRNRGACLTRQRMMTRIATGVRKVAEATEKTTAETDRNEPD